MAESREFFKMLYLSKKNARRKSGNYGIDPIFVVAFAVIE